VMKLKELWRSALAGLQSSEKRQPGRTRARPGGAAWGSGRSPV